jgi:hypothetical protein
MACEGAGARGSASEGWPGAGFRLVLRLERLRRRSGSRSCSGELGGDGVWGVWGVPRVGLLELVGEQQRLGRLARRRQGWRGGRDAKVLQYFCDHPRRRDQGQQDHLGLAARGAQYATMFPRGAVDRLFAEAAGRSLNHRPLHFGVDAQGVTADIAVAWANGPGLQVVAIVNGERTANAARTSRAFGKGSHVPLRPSLAHEAMSRHATITTLTCPETPSSWWSLPWTNRAMGLRPRTASTAFYGSGCQDALLLFVDDLGSRRSPRELASQARSC